MPSRSEVRIVWWRVIAAEASAALASVLDVPQGSSAGEAAPAKLAGGTAGCLARATPVGETAVGAEYVGQGVWTPKPPRTDWLRWICNPWCGRS